MRVAWRPPRRPRRRRTCSLAVLCAPKAIAAAAAAGDFSRPWATHAGCAELLRRFNFNGNYSFLMAHRLAVCVHRRQELPDWHGPERPALLSGEHFPVTVTPSPRGPVGYWVLPVWDYVVSNFVRIGGTFDPAELSLYKRLVREGDSVCDAGAHVGAYAIPLAAHVGASGAVHAFEPFRLVFQQLVANAAVNGLSNVYAHQLALGDKRERLRGVNSPALTRYGNVGATPVFVQPEEHFTSDNALQYEGRETVTVVPLDEMQLDRVGGLNFLKVDVEGALDRVLRGAHGTIHTHRPVMAVEHRGPGDGPALLLEWGYRCVEVLPVHELWICVPSERWWSFAWVTKWAADH
ncbi:unnamed protein product, partial [Prorocentrum cordatum]